jgi:hypothetical protein
VGINLIAQHIKTQLLSRGWKPNLLLQPSQFEELPPTVHVMKSNRQIESIQTIIRNRDTPMRVFFAALNIRFSLSLSLCVCVCVCVCVCIINNNYAYVVCTSIHSDDFVFYANRLSRLVIEEALKYLPFEEVSVETPTGAFYSGVKMRAKVCPQKRDTITNRKEGNERMCVLSLFYLTII